MTLANTFHSGWEGGSVFLKTKPPSRSRTVQRPERSSPRPNSRLYQDYLLMPGIYSCHDRSAPELWGATFVEWDMSQSELQSDIQRCNTFIRNVVSTLC